MMNKKLWFDQKTFNTPNGMLLDTEIISACELDFNDMSSKLKGYYNDAKDYERIYQYRSTLDSQREASIESKFNVSDNNILTYNLLRACCNSAHNKIAKITPKVTFLTKDASRQVIETAKKLDDWIFKIFKKVKIYKEASQAFLDACVKGIGVLKVYKTKEGKVKIKKISSSDIFFDNANYGDFLPKKAGEKKHLTPYELIELFPEREEQIKIRHGKDDLILVKEMYYTKKKKAIYTDKVLLSYEDWDYSLPYIFIKWSEATEGVVGVSISKEVYYIQQTITYILHRIIKAVHLFAVPRIIIRKGSNPTKLDIGNETGEFIELSSGDGDIIPLTPPAINEQVMRILSNLWEKGFEVTGLSQLQSHGQIPQGLKQASGAALRTYNQIESERFQLVRKDYENMFVTVAKKIIEFSTSYPSGVSKKEIEDVKDNASIFTSNILPETPAGRQAMVSDLFNSNLITRTQALSLIDSQDTNKLIRSDTARISAIDMELERAVKSGKTPDISLAPILGIEDYLDRARKIYADIVIEKGSEAEELITLNNVISQLQKSIQEQAQMNAVTNSSDNTQPDNNRNMQLENMQETGS